MAPVCKSGGGHVPRVPHQIVPINPRLSRTHTYNSAGSRTCPTNADTRYPCGLPRPVQNSNKHRIAFTAVVPNLFRLEIYFSCNIATIPRSASQVSTSHIHTYRFQPAVTNFKTLFLAIIEPPDLTSETRPLSNTYTYTPIQRRI